jgi:hypothetical protein
VFILGEIAHWDARGAQSAVFSRHAERAPTPSDVDVSPQLQRHAVGGGVHER